METEKSLDYPYIRLWGKMLGSMPYYINDQVRRARKDGAPQNATFFSTDEQRWQTTDDITANQTRRILGLAPLVAEPA
jgi:hypothetical protein